MGVEKDGTHCMSIEIFNASQIEIYSITNCYLFPTNSIYPIGGNYYMVLSEDYNKMFSFVINMDSAGEVLQKPRT